MRMPLFPICRVIALIGCLAGGPSSLHCIAQQRCREQVLDAIRHMQNSGSETVRTELEITSVPGDPEARMSTTTVRFTSQGEHSLVTSETFDRYSDPKNIVVVRKDEQAIYVYDKPLLAAPMGFDGAFAPDSALRMADVAQCRRTLTDEGEFLEVQLNVPDKPWADGVKWLRFKIDVGLRQVLNAEAGYRPGHRLRSYGVRYIRFEGGRRDPRLSSAALDHVMRNGRLATGYAGYHFYDRRKITKP